MIKYILSAIYLISSINIIKLLLIYIASIYYSEDFKKNINLKPKIVFIESLILIFLFSFSFWFLDNYLNSEFVILIFSIFFVSLIPSYDFIISPLKYISLKKEYTRNKELEAIIKNDGFNYNLVIIRGKILNAYATGILPFSKTILIGETLKNKMTKENLISIIYHEIGHLKYNHLTKLYFMNTILSLLSFLAFFTRQYFLKESETSFYEPLSVFILGLLIGLFFWYIPGKIQFQLELEADRFASEIVGKEKFESALNELDVLSAGDVSKGGHTHPKLSKRIEYIGRT